MASTFMWSLPEKEKDNLCKLSLFCHYDACTGIVGDTQYKSTCTDIHVYVCLMGSFKKKLVVIIKIDK